MWWETILIDCQQRIILCMTLHAAGKSDHGFVTSKPKTCVKEKIRMMEAHVSSDHVMA